jgi:hypothetical protein
MGHITVITDDIEKTIDKINRNIDNKIKWRWILKNSKVR